MLTALATVLLQPAPARAQEFNCNVVINDDAMPSVDKQVIAQMQQTITSFMNARRWTDDKYALEERINCNLLINLKESSNPGSGRYEATAQIQSSRPVYGTGYETLLFNYLDPKWAFEFTPGQPMDFNVNTHFSDLTSLLGYYAYVMLGYDADSFESLAGRKYFLLAQQIAGNSSQSGNAAGWRAIDGTNDRYWLTENMLNPQVQPFREGIYTYHRLSLDSFEQDAEQARTQVIDVLKKSQEVLRQKPMCLVVNLFFDAKANELVAIYNRAAPQEKQQAYNLLVELDRNNANQYEQLTE